MLPGGAIQTAGLQSFSGPFSLNGSGLQNLQNRFKAWEALTGEPTHDSTLLSKALKPESRGKKDWPYGPDGGMGKEERIEAFAKAIPGAVVSVIGSVMLAFVGAIAGAAIGGAGAVILAGTVLRAPVYISVLSGLAGGIGGGIAGGAIGFNINCDRAG
ncbi:MAG: hypothetical protein HYU64_15245 [Armatimonadetes bacterium]|nr:hypothetical protein [Armatimonadota bacterium]